MVVMKKGKTVPGDILEMVKGYEVHSSGEAWLICQLGEEIKKLRIKVKTLTRAVNKNG